MSERPKILIVDDNAGNRLAVRTVLKSVDAQLDEAANGLDALSMVVEEDYALILLDVQMPEMDGYEVCEQLRADPRTANTPVIFLTAAFKDDVDKVHGYVAGATDYLAKPIDDHILRAKVQVFLKLQLQNRLLKESASRINAILETALDAVVGIDHDGHITQWNTRAELIFGWTQREVMGQTLEQTIIPPKHRDAHRHGMQRYLTTKESCILSRRIEIVATRRSGVEFPIELSILPFKVGLTYHFTAFIADITERKVTEEGLRRFRAIVDSTDDAVIGKTLAGVITSWNDGAQKIFGYSATEAIGKSIHLLVPQDREQEEEDILRRIANGEKIVHFDTVRRHKDGHAIDISATISPILDKGGGVIGVSKIARDITDQREGR
ncbi:MAG: PAS domain S-box protein [Anaerolineales bacterium]|nr:PAS domain S-box protein [Anaerolineales bacterium]